MKKTNSYIKNLYCPKCEKKYSHKEIQQLCTCGAPLLVAYDLEKASKELKKDDLKERNADLWRYKELLPVEAEENIITLGEGMTPLLSIPKAGAYAGIENLYIKDEGIIPTGTFKARGAAVGVSKAKELGIRSLAMPTNGNAGAAWSIYSAKAEIEANILMPEDAPSITRNECAAAGAKLYLVNGLISDCGKIVGTAVKKYGWFDASTLKEPYRIEGKKTMGLEIAEQFSWEVPDVILYPTGGGVGIIGIYKALKELQEIGWIGKKLPRLVAVQAEGCAPIVKAYQEHKEESEFWKDSETVAFGINVPKALGDFLVLQAIYDTQGCAVSVTDSEIITALEKMASLEGNFICPEGAAVYAAAASLRKDGWIKKDDKVVLLNTGAGIKYPNTLKCNVPHLEKEAEL